LQTPRIDAMIKTKLERRSKLQMNEDEFNKLLSLIKYSEQALERIYDFYYPRIVLHISIKYNREIAEDIAQEFFLNLMKTHSFNYIKNPTSWIYKSCENLAKRRFNDEVASDLIDDESSFPNLSDADNLVEEISNRDELNKIFSVIDDPITKQIFYLFYVEGYNLREVSEILGMKRSTVKQKHTRTIRKLKVFFNIVAKK